MQLMRDVDLKIENGVQVHRVVQSGENALFPPMSFDAVVTNLSMHWVNDLPSNKFCFLFSIA